MMASIRIDTGALTKTVPCGSHLLKVQEIWAFLEEIIGLSRSDFYIVSNGRPVYDENICLSNNITIVPRLVGGKGGFGSMLRAIGAQIEKTTNREACRDLSGRRLRDINEEKRLKAWIEKQAKRDEEAAERKKRKLERLCTEPKHEFKDKNYEHERSVLTERVGNAVEEGFKLATAGTSTSKGNCKTEGKAPKKTLLDFDIDSDELESTDDSEDEEPALKKVKTESGASIDSGHSSDETDKTSKVDGTMSEYSESSCENQAKSDKTIGTLNAEDTSGSTSISESVKIENKDNSQS